jgi:hypothetical protein
MATRDWNATLHKARAGPLPPSEAQSILSAVSAAQDSKFDGLRPSDLYEILSNIEPLCKSEAEQCRIDLCVKLWKDWGFRSLVLLRGIPGDQLLQFERLLEFLNTGHLAPRDNEPYPPSPVILDPEPELDADRDNTYYPDQSKN